MSIARRITLFSSLWLLVLLIVVNSGIYLLFGQMTARAELERVGLQTQTIAETIRPDRLGVGNPGDILRAYTPSNGIIRVINEDSQPFIEATKYPELREIPVTYSSKQETEQIRFADDRYVISRFPIIWSDGSVVTLEYSEQMVTYDSTMATLRLVLFIASISLLLPAIFAGRALSRIILLPIKTLTKTMENIRQDGTFERIQVPEQSKDELDQMGQTFNRMIELLEENYKKQQQFVSDASHELRTPLTVIESYTSLLKRWGKAKPELLEEAVEAIYEESGRMKGLTEQMLALAIGRNDQPTKLSEFELGKLVHDIAKRLEQTFNRKIHVNVNEHYFISADEAQIKQLIFILLENGLKYSDDSLSVDIVDEDREIRLDVRDKGIGIPENDLPYVFERFFRVDKARSRQTGGSGLGLAIAKSIIQAHSGEITVRSLENIGTTFTVILPKGNKSAKGEDYAGK
ncbi:sensor histidine kinase [Halalkalibacter krulwichiae]|uniref:sensor histidine kinase n=1 Tax=Halalkalibacter krulwichiae TaxID=199441 RepID=UPI000825C9B6|nr:ATP-binding protein [Halalkalibacter krulwichiae]